MTRPRLEDVYLELTATERAAERAGRSLTRPAAARGRRRLAHAPGASTASSAGCSGATRRAAFFNFLLPLLFLALFGAIFAGNQATCRSSCRASPG